MTDIIANGEAGATARSKINVLMTQGAPTGYAANGVAFGSGNFLERAVGLSASASRKGTLSFWYNDLGVPTSNTTFLMSDSLNNGAGSGLGCQFEFTGTYFLLLSVIMGNATGSRQIVKNSALANWKQGSWNHLLASWDITSNPGTFGAVLNGIPIFSPPLADGGFDIDYASANDPSFPKFDVGVGSQQLSEIFLDTVHAVVTAQNTISTSNIRKFISGGKPVSLGADGSTPFSAQPALYFKGNAASIVTNLGTGGAFALTGILTNAATSPSD